MSSVHMGDLFFGTRISEAAFRIDMPEFHHCVHVTRHTAGSKLLITAFDGWIYQGTIDRVEKDHALVSATGIHKHEDCSGAKLAVAISLTHQPDRLEWFVEKAVECGIHAIYPMQCRRTQSRRFAADRLNRIIHASAKQTLRPLKPMLAAFQALPEVLADTVAYPLRFYGDCAATHQQFLGKLARADQDTLVFIGPEGDFSEDEFRLLSGEGCVPVSLGRYRLRTETAGLAALQILQTLQSL
ncbi:MAG: 16S rRNA (uracil(1498)-N(3))-methyltransferase [Saprospiraceae bacterium]|nr:16S rRNA (uracil(1498)-N(3))-methyltransferase [Saprospiraceae bacterium]MBP9210495.1 16S rRNA (uracil(1498)-N(3))-methyltransferase [Saprospiraceae bacterium]